MTSSASTNAPRRVAVIGGGISGLAAAHHVHELDPSAHITLFEAGGRVGGVLESVRRDGWLIERSADMFTTREPWASSGPTASDSPSRYGGSTNTRSY